MSDDAYPAFEINVICTDGTYTASVVELDDSGFQLDTLWSKSSTDLATLLAEAAEPIASHAGA
ncbi:Uncharacterised protein (plasmid) [Tsukamurella tyrosinosolvens]|uniref:Uncharacterized protein n=1 Tax=Tsukamurella tyrosinosolvens TaxID=57704 RepID=A0A1H4VCG0_TSUTY|nr:hypothetical protein [Tsukamurella tyrosinosolvens]KXO91008.1 hypothetical protein AXK58_21495 [Tsukamurella tyrosinosolvens]SEC78643.1 hypothetical protein SAMN04489793_3193 [Tsukamurella tyrosinosolvens]VEH90588.1 Uncharacterised protein [Tsukamurella tyrosinosolvens]